jgi:hypothetical protein
VRIDPVDFSEIARHQDPFPHIEDGGGRVVGPKRSGRDKHQECASYGSLVSQVFLLLRRAVEYITAAYVP